MADPKPSPLIQHPLSARLKRALERCRSHLKPWSGVMYRACGIEYANRVDLLSGQGSKRHGARWTPRGAFATVYGSLDPLSALLETLGTGGRYGVPYLERLPLVMVAVNVNLDRVLDLTWPEVRRILRVSPQRMLSEDWAETQRAGREALTHALARLAFESRIEALLVPSARLKNAKNLAIFPEIAGDTALEIQNVEKLPEPQRPGRPPD